MVLKIFHEESGVWQAIEMKIQNYKDLYSYPSIKRANEHFMAHPVHEITSNDFPLYINQSEIGYNISENDFDFIGSDDATTCHIILASLDTPLPAAEATADSSPRRWLICHMASLTHFQQLTRAFDDMSSTADGIAFEVSLMGGLGDDPCSEELTLGFINLFQSSLRHTFHLKLFFTCEVNTILKDTTDTSGQTAIPYPRYYGCGYHPHSQAIIPLYFPLEFRGPDSLLRSMALWLGTADSSPAEDNSGDHDHHSGCNLPPIIFQTNSFSLDLSFLLTPLPQHTMEFFQSIVSLPSTQQHDALLLRVTSTSPHCEPIHFVPSIRLMARAILELFSERGECLYEGARKKSFLLLREQRRGWREIKE
jgi:hypothetical protein